MKNLLITILSFFFVFLMFSCSKDEVTSSGGQDINQPETVPMEFIVENGEAVVTRLPNQEAMTIPSSIDYNNETYTVTTIGSQAYNTKITSLTIPSTIKRIQENAFVDSKIETLYIEDLASWCNIIFEESWHLGNEPYPYCNSNPITPSTKLFVGGEEIGSELYITDEVSEISAYAFQNLNITKLFTGKDVAVIGQGAFYSCTNLKDVQFGDNLREISREAFRNSSVSEFTFPSSLEIIGFYAFFDSKILNKVVFKSTDLNISIPSFEEVSNVYVPDLDTWYGYEFSYPNSQYYNWAPFTHYSLYFDGVILEDLKVTEENSEKANLGRFSGCSSLKSVTFEEGIISSGGFESCSSLKTVYLPSTLERFEEDFLYHCNSLEGIYLKAKKLPLLTIDVNTLPEEVVLYVPSESLELYRNSKTWGKFRHIEPLPLE